MKAKRYYDYAEVYHSSVFGNGTYEWNDDVVQDPLCGDTGDGAISPLLTNVKTGELFFMKRFECGDKLFHCYKERIIAPPPSQYVLWPSDMLELNQSQRAACTLFLARDYSESPKPIIARDDSRAFLFPYGGYPFMMNAVRKLAQLDQINWKNPQIRQMAVSLAKALEDLNRSGYFYVDFHLSRLYFKADNTAFLDFSSLIFTFDDLRRMNVEEICHLEPEEYPIEFADPAVVRRLIAHVDYHSQNYSLCALFFYLFVGRYAYDGRLLTGYADDSPQTHYTKFRDYHKVPVFIFDPEDPQNGLGIFYEDQQVIELWEELPECLRELFVKTLRRENAEREVQVNNPTPSTWLKCFEELGWC